MREIELALEVIIMKHLASLEKLKVKHRAVRERCDRCYVVS